MSFIRDLVLPPDAAVRAAAWQQAERTGDDRSLVALRELDQATAPLPTIIDGVRRTRMLAADAVATTWEGWQVDDGQRVMLRCLQPRWLSDPVLLRRFAQSADRARCLQQAGQAPLTHHVDGDWPHLRLPCGGAPVVDLLPVEDLPDSRQQAAILGAGLQTLATLHAAGYTHGGPIAPLLSLGPTGARLSWLDGLCPGRQATDDLRALAVLVVALDPGGQDPFGQLARSWVHTPPPSAADGLRLLTATLARVLLDRRHSLAMARRRVGRRDRATRLAQLARALGRSQPPPLPMSCVKVDQAGVGTLLHSDATVIRGGVWSAQPTATLHIPAPGQLPIIWSRQTGLQPQAARKILRAWATKDSGQPELRQRYVLALGGSDDTVAQLMRWLQATATLRRAQLLLTHQARPFA